MPTGGGGGGGGGPRRQRSGCIRSSGRAHRQDTTAACLPDCGVVASCWPVKGISLSACCLKGIDSGLSAACLPDHCLLASEGHLPACLLPDRYYSWLSPACLPDHCLLTSEGHLHAFCLLENLLITKLSLNNISPQSLSSEPVSFPLIPCRWQTVFCLLNNIPACRPAGACLFLCLPWQLLFL